MKAKLVTISFIRRVVVEDNATEDEMILKAINKIRELDDIEMMENFEKVEDDIEYPFDPEIDNGGGYI
jgi:hypothetical protein